MRALLRISVKLALLIAIPTLIIGPAILLLLQGADSASAFLATIGANLASLSISLLIAVVVAAMLIAFCRSFLRQK